MISIVHSRLVALAEDDLETEEVNLDFSDGTTGDVDFLAWTSPTYIQAFDQFEKGNAYAMDITKVNGDWLPSRASGGAHLGDEGSNQNLRRAAHSGRGHRVTARSRVFGGHISTIGYACALPLGLLHEKVHTKRYTLYGAPEDREQSYTFTFDTPKYILIWTGISFIDPFDRFKHRALAIDIPEIDGSPTVVYSGGGEFLGDGADENDDRNLFQGVYAGLATTVKVRFRVFGDDLMASGFACLLYS